MLVLPAGLLTFVFVSLITCVTDPRARPIARAAKIDPRCLMEAVAMGADSVYRLAYEGDWPDH